MLKTEVGMPQEWFYKTVEWKRLRKEVLRRDGGRCTVEGCGKLATVVDHIVGRKKGEAGMTEKDTVGNLRSLCAEHDNQRKEGADGKRRGDVDFFVRGGDKNGWPRDPKHPWNAGVKKVEGES